MSTTVEGSMCQISGLAAMVFLLVQVHTAAPGYAEDESVNPMSYGSGGGTVGDEPSTRTRAVALFDDRLERLQILTNAAPDGKDLGSAASRDSTSRDVVWREGSYSARRGVKIRWAERQLADGTLQRHGTATLTYESGRPWINAELVDGRIEGRFIAYHDNGRKLEEVFFANGLRTGPFQTWYATGQPHSKGQFSAGKLSAAKVSWYPSGERLVASDWRGGELHGARVSFHQNGNLCAVEEWNAGKKVRQKIWLKYGSPDNGIWAYSFAEKPVPSWLNERPSFISEMDADLVSVDGVIDYLNGDARAE